MMRILIDRAWKKADYTISRLFVDGERWCEALEDTDRGLKDSMRTEEIKAKFPHIPAFETYDELYSAIISALEN